MPTLIRVSGKPFTCGLLVSGGVVTEAAPVMRWAVGKPLQTVKNWVRTKGYTWEPMPRLVAPLRVRSLLRRVVSGGQVGSDVAGLRAAKRAGLETGGFIPLGFLTIRGMRPELGKEFGLVETVDSRYPTRTHMNAAHSDGTLRIAYNWKSPGERLTLREVLSMGKPYFDVDPHDPIPPRRTAEWIVYRRIETLNVAGNADEAIEPFVEAYLAEVFGLLGWKG